MFIPLTLAASLIFPTSGISLKDNPPPAPRYTQRNAPVPAKRPAPPRSVEPEPYVYIQGGGDARLPMSEAEMAAYGYRTGDVIPLKEAAKIIEDRLAREGR